MDLREKLIELLENAFMDCDDNYGMPNIDQVADNLIANGVTAQKCNLGDKIYQIDGVRIYESTVQEITITVKHTIFVTENIAFDERAIGKSIFLSYAEAETHLTEPPKGD